MTHGVGMAIQPVSHRAHRGIAFLPHPKRFEQELALLVGKIAETVQISTDQGRMSVSNAKLTAFAIIEMAEGVPEVVSPRGEVSMNQLAYLYGEHALHIAGVYNTAQPNKQSRTAAARPHRHR